MAKKRTKKKAKTRDELWSSTDPADIRALDLEMSEEEIAEIVQSNKVMEHVREVAWSNFSERVDQWPEWGEGMDFYDHMMNGDDNVGDTLGEQGYDHNAIMSGHSVYAALVEEAYPGLYEEAHDYVPKKRGNPEVVQRMMNPRNY